ncbi:hypothetical protein BZG24_28215, partial [Escherichia coli]|nr:hypothetical protein [Escherichia coli]
YNSPAGVFIDGEHHRIDVPTGVQVRLHRLWVLFAPQTQWEHQGQQIAAGSLAIARLDAFLESGSIEKVLFTPDAHTALESLSFTANYLLLTVLH